MRAHIAQALVAIDINLAENFSNLVTLQCGQRYYASTFFQDFQNVFHYINPGVLWKVSSVVSCSCSKFVVFCIKNGRLRRKKRKSGWPELLFKLANFVCIIVWPQIYEDKYAQ